MIGIYDRGTMHPDEAVRIEVGLKVLHGFFFQVLVIFCMDHDIIAFGLKKNDLIYGNDTHFMT